MPRLKTAPSGQIRLIKVLAHDLRNPISGILAASQCLIEDASTLLDDQQMTLLTADARAPGGIEGTGGVLVVDHTGDNTLVSFRFKLANVKMAAAEEAFDADGHHVGAGAIIIENANRAQLDPVLKQLGLRAWAVASAPTGSRSPSVIS